MGVNRYVLCIFCGLFLSELVAQTSVYQSPPDRKEELCIAANNDTSFVLGGFGPMGQLQAHFVGLVGKPFLWRSFIHIPPDHDFVTSGVVTNKNGNTNYINVGAGFAPGGYPYVNSASGSFNIWFIVPIKAKSPTVTINYGPSGVTLSGWELFIRKVALDNYLHPYISVDASGGLPGGVTANPIGVVVNAGTTSDFVVTYTGYDDIVTEGVPVVVSFHYDPTLSDPNSNYNPPNTHVPPVGTVVQTNNGTSATVINNQGDVITNTGDIITVTNNNNPFYAGDTNNTTNTTNYSNTSVTNNDGSTGDTNTQVVNNAINNMNNTVTNVINNLGGTTADGFTNVTGAINGLHNDINSLLNRTVDAINANSGGSGGDGTDMSGVISAVDAVGVAVDAVGGKIDSLSEKLDEVFEASPEELQGASSVDMQDRNYLSAFSRLLTPPAAPVFTIPIPYIDPVVIQLSQLPASLLAVKDTIRALASLFLVLGTIIHIKRMFILA